MGRCKAKLNRTCVDRFYRSLRPDKVSSDSCIAPADNVTRNRHVRAFPRVDTTRVIFHKDANTLSPLPPLFLLAKKFLLPLRSELNLVKTLRR